MLDEAGTLLATLGRLYGRLRWPALYRLPSRAVRTTREATKIAGVTDTQTARKVVTTGDYGRKARSAFDTVFYRVFLILAELVKVPVLPFKTVALDHSATHPRRCLAVFSWLVRFLSAPPNKLET